MIQKTDDVVDAVSKSLELKMVSLLSDKWNRMYQPTWLNIKINCN